MKNLFMLLLLSLLLGCGESYKNWVIPPPQTKPSAPGTPAGKEDPAEPTEPVEPTEPTDPAEPAEPTDPIEPEDPDVPTYLVTNEYVQKFLEEVSYQDWEFTTTLVRNYPGGGPGEADIPPSVEIKWDASGAQGGQTLTLWDSDWTRQYALGVNESTLSVTNLVPDDYYHYKVTDKSGQVMAEGGFKTTGALHQVYFSNNVRNGRDLGGLKTQDGKTLRYRMLYRGGRVDKRYMNDAGRAEALAVGIKAELDLREKSSVPNSSCFGSSIAFCAPGFEDGENYRTMLRDRAPGVKECFSFIVKCLKENKPVYFHCAAGRDRTGTIAALVLGLLGVREGDIARDYELTYFSPADWSMHKGIYEHLRTASSYGNCVKYLRDFGNAGNLKKGAENYLLSIGITQEEINDFRTLMLK